MFQQIWNIQEWYDYLTPILVDLSTKSNSPNFTNFYQKSFKLDPLMTTGYSASIILSKSRIYSQSI